MLCEDYTCKHNATDIGKIINF